MQTDPYVLYLIQVCFSTTWLVSPVGLCLRNRWILPISLSLDAFVSLHTDSLLHTGLRRGGGSRVREGGGIDLEGGGRKAGRGRGSRGRNVAKVLTVKREHRMVRGHHPSCRAVAGCLDFLVKRNGYLLLAIRSNHSG